MLCQEFCIFSLYLKPIILNCLCCVPAMFCFVFESETETTKSLIFHCRSHYGKSMFVVGEVRFLEQQSKILNPCLTSWISVLLSFFKEQSQHTSSPEWPFLNRKMLA